MLKIFCLLVFSMRQHTKYPNIVAVCIMSENRFRKILETHIYRFMYYIQCKIIIILLDASMATLQTWNRTQNESAYHTTCKRNERQIQKNEIKVLSKAATTKKKLANSVLALNLLWALYQNDKNLCEFQQFIKCKNVRLLLMLHLYSTEKTIQCTAVHIWSMDIKTELYASLK